jgi:hypothetical protein
VLFLPQRLLKLHLLPHYLAYLLPVFTVTKYAARFPHCNEVAEYIIKELWNYYLITSQNFLTVPDVSAEKGKVHKGTKAL